MPHAEPQVSVVVPVYNAMPYLREFLDSLAGQELDSSSFDVIAVDDGSTDGSAEVLDQFGNRHPNVRVIHQLNSGAPGRPRNVGLRSSTARYVFFADADDIVGRETLHRLVGFADEHGSDVVIPKLTALAGRGLPTSVYEKTLIDADLPTAFNTLFPQKLYRRRLLTDHDIRFAEGRTHLEDGIFNATAYVHAKRISILSDYDFYFLRAREDDRNFSREELEPAGYTSAVSEICRIVRKHLGDSDTADQIVLGLYRRKCLHIYQPRRFAGYDPSIQDAWMAAHKSFVERFVTEALERRLDSPFRERAYFVRRGDKAGLLGLSEVQKQPVVNAMLSHAAWSDEGLEVVVHAAIYGRLNLPRQIICEIRPRDGEGLSAFQLVRREADAPEHGESSEYVGVFSGSSIEALIPGMYDLYVMAASGQERFSTRLRWHERVNTPPEDRGLRIYGSKGGNVGIDKAAAVQARSSRLRNALSRVATKLGWRR